jgi:hypothetical protein
VKRWGLGSDISGTRHSDHEREGTGIFGPVDGILEVIVAQGNPGKKRLGVFGDDGEPPFPFCAPVRRRKGRGGTHCRLNRQEGSNWRWKSSLMREARNL